LRALAGFSAKEPNYYLGRNVFPPPDFLARRNFPQVEDISAQLLMQLQNEDLPEQYEHSISLSAFLDLLRFFRTVILEDAVILMDLPGYGDHPIFKNEIFQGPEFQAYKR
jgi:hypothetical protein